MNLDKLTTEKRNPYTKDIDMLNTFEMIEKINQEDKKIAFSIEKVIPEISEGVDLIYDTLKSGGRLIYIGAGTSGRLGILDASEAPPTFGVSENTIKGVIAGGKRAITSAIENAEDSKKDAEYDLKEIDFNREDILVGITASGRTPYVIGGLQYAKSMGAKTIGISNNKDSKLYKLVDVCIEVEVGPEVITGSTRMKSGTAQKMVINMLSTGAMIKLGKVYENLMIDLKPTNLKLKQRSKNIIVEATDIDEDKAQEYLDLTNYDVKLSIFMIKSGLDMKKAKEILAKNEGHIRKALKSI